MSWVAVAVGGASLVTGYLGNKGAKDAAKASAQGSDRAAQVQWDMFNQARSDNEPWRQAGLTGLSEYMTMLGLPTSNVQSAAAGGVGASSAMSPSGAIEWFDWSRPTPVADPESYRNDPLYKQAWDEVWAYHNGRFDKTSDRQAIANHLQSIYDSKRAASGGTQQSGAGGAGSSSGFDQYARAAYLNSNPDVKAAGIDPFTHYNIAGKAEGRTWGGGDALQLMFSQTPGYQFGFNEGQRALESSAAAGGGLFSGKAAKALTKYGQDYAGTKYNDRLSQLAGLAGIGQSATSQNNQLGMTTAGNVGQAYQAAGNARASGIQGSANAWGGTINQLAGLGGYMYGNRWGGV